MSEYRGQHGYHTENKKKRVVKIYRKAKACGNNIRRPFAVFLALLKVKRKSHQSFHQYAQEKHRFSKA